MKQYFSGKLSLKFEQPRYFVNEKGRVVACKLGAYLTTPYQDRFGFARVYFESEKFDCVGIARCAPDDDFDENRGKRIAYARAENAVYSAVNAHLDGLRKEMAEATAIIDRFTETTYKCRAHNVDYVDSLSFPAHPNYQKEVLPPKK